MSAAVALWLPPAQAGDVERAASVLVERWAGAWLASAGGIRVKSYSGRSTADLRWVGSAGAAAGIAPASLAKLGLALVAGQADLDNPADRAVLGRIAEAASNDLGERLTSLAGEDVSAAEGAPASANLVLRVAPQDEGWSVGLSLGPAAQTALRKAAAGQARQPRLGRLADALAPEPIKIGCHLGTATISASELAELGEGDLIAFDRRVGDDLPLTFAAANAKRGTAKVIHDGAEVVVRIAESVDFKSLHQTSGIS